MRVFDILDEQGRLLAFEIENEGLGRRRASVVLFSVPGSRQVRGPKALSWLREDSFCEAELQGVRFLIEEPFGDNSRYWVGPTPPQVVPATALVRSAFESARTPALWRQVALIVVMVALAVAAIWSRR